MPQILYPLKKFILSLVVVTLVLFSCSKDDVAPETFTAKSDSLHGTWNMIKYHRWYHRIGLVMGESIVTPAYTGYNKIDFSEDLFQNTPNTKKASDSSTGLVRGEFVSGTILYGTWSVFHKDSVAIGNYKYSVDKLTTTELELTRRHADSDTSYSIITWYLTK